MTLSTRDCLAAIRRYSSAPRRGGGRQPIRSCGALPRVERGRPRLASHRGALVLGGDSRGPLDAPPAETDRPARTADAGLIEAFRDGAGRLVAVLAAADQSDACWTWADQKDQKNVAFVTRHQVQEAAVHAWDATNAAGQPLAIDSASSADAVDEFSPLSLATEEDARRESLPPLDGIFVLHALDTGHSWTVRDGAVPGSVLASVRPASRTDPSAYGVAADDGRDEAAS